MADVFATAEEIARRFFLVGRHVNGREGASPIKDSELPRIATVGLNSIAGASGNQRRGDDVTRNVPSTERALQLEAARTGFVTAADRSLATKTLDEAKNREAIRRGLFSPFSLFH